MKNERVAFAGLVIGLAVAIGPALGAQPAWADGAQARYWFERGVALEEKGERAAALEAYERALSADDDHEQAYRRAARLWISLQAFDRAIPRLERYTLRHPDRTWAWYSLAYAYRRTERWEYAVLAYESYLELRPGDAAPYFGLAMALLQLGRRADARHAFTRYLALEEDPERTVFVAQARRQLERLGAPEVDGGRTETDHETPAISTGGQGQAGPDHIVYRYMERAESLLAAGRLDAAHALASRITPADPAQASALLWLSARVAVARQRPDEARTMLLALLAAVPTHVDAYRLLRILADEPRVSAP